jgi:hypothetical protein
VAAATIGVLAMSPVAHADPPRRPVQHRVQAGESLWGIARAFLTHVEGHRPTAHAVNDEARTIYALNRSAIGPDPSVIRVGQRLLLSEGLFAGDIADGEPGWGGGFRSCVDQPPPARSTAPADGLTFRLSLPSVSVPQGGEVRATWAVHNASSSTVSFSTESAAGDVLTPVTVDARGRAVGEVLSNDLNIIRVWHLAPGATKTGSTPVRLRSCADTSALTAPALAPGSYRVIGTFTWSRSAGRSYDYGTWAAPAVVVRVSPRRA